jgi:hypothetical protein
VAAQKIIEYYDEKPNPNKEHENGECIDKKIGEREPTIEQHESLHRYKLFGNVSGYGRRGNRRLRCTAYSKRNRQNRRSRCSGHSHRN